MECGLVVVEAVFNRLVALKNRTTLIASYNEKGGDVTVELVEDREVEIYTLRVEQEYAVPSFNYFSAKNTAPVTLASSRDSLLIFLVQAKELPATLMLTQSTGD
jgi:hypothetical protein